jgi:hypothetical protein
MDVLVLGHNYCRVWYHTLKDVLHHRDGVLHGIHTWDPVKMNCTLDIYRFSRKGDEQVMMLW